MHTRQRKSEPGRTYRHQHSHLEELSYHATQCASPGSSHPRFFTADAQDAITKAHSVHVATVNRPSVTVCAAGYIDGPNGLTPEFYCPVLAAEARPLLEGVR